MSIAILMAMNYGNVDVYSISREQNICFYCKYIICDNDYK